MSAPLEHYRVGDRVRLIEDLRSGDSGDQFTATPGTLGTVTEVKPTHAFPIKATFDGEIYAEYPWHLLTDEIELVHEDL